MRICGHIHEQGKHLHYPETCNLVSGNTRGGFTKPPHVLPGPEGPYLYASIGVKPIT